MIDIIKLAIQLAVLILGAIFERNKEKKALKKEALSELQTGLTEKNPSTITSAFDRYHRI